MIRVMLVEDEPHARNKLRELIQAEPDLEIVGECADGPQALRSIAIEQPDLLFLDIEIPGLNGVNLVKSLDRAYSPYIIVTTAYSEHAVWAFDANALDYLLKPYDKARFQRALHRARVIIHKASDTAGGPADAPAKPQDDSVAATLSAGMLKMKVGTRIKFVAMAKIRYIKAKGDHVLVNTVDEEFPVRERIKNMEEALDTGYFIRVHRSALLNVNYIKEMKSRLHGDYEITMQGGAVFRSSASYRESVRSMMKRG